MTEHRAQRPASPRPAIGRRALLTGAAATAGLVLGGGSVQLAHAVSDDQAAPPNIPSPGEELMVEHGVLKRLLLCYEAMRQRIEDRQSLNPGVVGDAAQIISDYVESFHEGLEEAYVFPRVAPIQPALIRTLLVQHDHGRHLTAAIQDLAGTALTAPATRTALAAHLSAFARMYAPHEAWEDTVVYPTLRQVTPQRTIDQLAERFHDLEARQYGDSALRTILARVGGIEEQLDIHDLNTFTPPPL
jgi:hemerythrin-like domain-containing protein